MKAIRVYTYGPPQVMRLEERPDPQPGAGQVVIEVQAIGVNPVDTYKRAGIFGYTAKMPYTPGVDAAGIVEAIGVEVTRVSIGDRVYCGGAISGTYAQKALCLESQLNLLPEHLTYAQGAAIAVPYTAAYRALHDRARAKPREILLVHGGSGSVGLAAVQLGRAYDMIVIATAGSAAGRRLLEKQGAYYSLDHHDPHHLDEVLDLTSHHGADVILEMLADKNLGNDLRVAAKGGRVVIIGCRGLAEINPRDAMTRDLAIFGMSLRNCSNQNKARINDAILDGLSCFNLRPIIHYELPLEAAAQAHNLIIDSPSLGKIILLP